jgi:hypothetical protein
MLYPAELRGHWLPALNMDNGGFQSLPNLSETSRFLDDGDFVTTLNRRDSEYPSRRSCYLTT